MLIQNYKDRVSRAEKKRVKVLKFLRDETWTTPFIISLVIELSQASAYKVLKQLKAEGLVRSYFVDDLRITTWGITTAGLMESWDDEETAQNRSYFQPSKLKSVMVQHHIMLQQARVGLTGRRTNYYLKTSKKGLMQ